MATARAPSHNPLRVAIIGGGIAGAALAAGLSVAHTRGDIRVRLYELVVTYDIEEEDSPVEGGGCVHNQDDGEQSCDLEVLQASSPRI